LFRWYFVSLNVQKDNRQLSFSTIAIAKRKIKRDFFNQIDQLLNWAAIDAEIKKHYAKGASVAGRPSYPGLLLFKMSLLQTWYGLSDYEVEDRINDSLSFMQFVGLTLDDEVPDNSVLSRFRTTLTQKNAYEPLMDLINEQLEAKGIVLRKGAIVDASITDSPRKPRGKKEYEQVATDREESAATATSADADTPVQDADTADNPATPSPQQPVFMEKIQSHVDTEASWVKKAGKLHYGYKKHVVTDEQGLVLAMVTTPANESDIVHLEDVVGKANLPKGIRVGADKGYCSKSNREYLGGQGLKDGIMHKAVRNKKLSGLQIAFNKIVSKVRYRVERTFGGMKRWFGAGTARYLGIAKTHTQHIMEGLAYNLYRSPGIVVLNELKAQSENNK